MILHNFETYNFSSLNIAAETTEFSGKYDAFTYEKVEDTRKF
jgi:hypothetical protein